MRPKELSNWKGTGNAYKFYKGKDPITPLSVHWRIEQARVARYWSMKPRQFRALPPDEAAELHAIWRVEREIEAYESSESMKRIDEKTSKVSSGNRIRPKVG